MFEKDRLEIMKFKNNIIFSYFSDLQIPIANNEIPEIQHIAIDQPIYDDLISKSNENKKNSDGYLSFIGGFHVRKGIHKVLDVTKNMKSEKYNIHSYPVRENSIRFLFGIFAE